MNCVRTFCFACRCRQQGLLIFTGGAYTQERKTVLSLFLRNRASANNNPYAVFCQLIFRRCYFLPALFLSVSGFKPGSTLVENNYAELDALAKDVGREVSRVEAIVPREFWSTGFAG